MGRAGAAAVGAIGALVKIGFWIYQFYRHGGF